MNKIKTSELYFDISERLDNALQQGRITNDIFKKVHSRPRIFFAMNEAVRFFATRADVPMNALAGLITKDPFYLKELGTAKNLATYEWPEGANQSRADGGILRLFLDGKVFEPALIADPIVVNRRLISLQAQAENELMYGAGQMNALVDLPGGRIFVPKDVETKAEIIERPDRVSTLNQAKGKAILRITGPALGDGTITLTNTTDNENVTADVEADDPIHIVAAALDKAIDESSVIGIESVFFGDELRLYTAGMGSGAAVNVTVSAGTSGVTFSDSSLSLTPQETAEIPIDQTHQETLAVSAMQQLLGGVAFLGSSEEVVEEDVG